MQYSAMNFNIKNVFIRYYDRVVSIQKHWIQIRSNNERRYELIVKLWDREVDIMSAY